MQLTAELTMYPLQEDYIPAIEQFIEQLHKYPGLKIITGPTCTVVGGNYEVVMEAITDAMFWSHRALGRAVFVAKFIPDYELPADEESS